MAYILLAFFSLLSVIVPAFSAQVCKAKSRCRQAIFLKKPDPSFPVNVTKTLNVASKMECTQHCLRDETCNSVRYRTIHNSNDITNCQLVANIIHQELSPESHGNGEGWQLYIMHTAQSMACNEKKYCQNGGSCIADMCAPVGYSCDCKKSYNGKHCENRVTNLNINAKKVSLSQFTLTGWYKSGLNSSTQYPFLVYKADDEISNAIDVYFNSSISHPKIHSFHVEFGDNSIRSEIIPFNDGHWHHIGLVWNNTLGDLQLLIDGVLWAKLDPVKAGECIQTGSTAIIGQRKDLGGKTYNLTGTVSRLNFWSFALTGQAIELLANTSSLGGEQGDLISWDAIKDSFDAALRLVPSEVVDRIGDTVNYEMAFGVDYVGIGNAGNVVIKQITACTWFRSENTNSSLFFWYQDFVESSSGRAIAFGYGVDKILIAYINGVGVKSSPIIKNNNWHFLCMTWDGVAGVLNFYFDGLFHSGGDRNPGELKTSITYYEGVFAIGGIDNGYSLVLDTSLRGTLTQLNIWGSVLHDDNILVMSAGGSYIYGDMLAWGILHENVFGYLNNAEEVFLPGFSVLKRRTDYCINYVKSDSTVARFGNAAGYQGYFWRCYLVHVMLPAKYAYDMATNSGAYYTMGEQLLQYN